MPGWDEVDTWTPAPEVARGMEAIAEHFTGEQNGKAPAGETPPIDVQTIMGPPEGEPAATSEPLTGEVRGEPETVFQQKKKRGPRKPKEVDLLGEMLKQAQFGQMAVVTHTLFYRAVRTPERPCPDLSPEEAQLVDYGTTQYMRHLIETSEEARKYTPLAALFLCNMIPMLARIQPIAEAATPFWQRAWDWLKGRFRRDRNT